jgi:hypothetical protein
MTAKPRATQMRNLLFICSLSIWITNKDQDKNNDKQQNDAADQFAELRKNEDGPDEAASEVVGQASVAHRAEKPAVEGEEHADGGIGGENFLFDTHVKLRF